jgi:hypothetical protein
MRWEIPMADDMAELLGLLRGEHALDRA